ncbi:pyridoxal phosphate-dependent decarboxylase family protein, partial [Parasphingorhabdus sp.]|uniref:pyridoxal phosphate-dependent decarboxylase family protein n=1 Tax=Parasphingorhabdus sp. TaxID=2709688 RepID=UPI003C743F13
VHGSGTPGNLIADIAASAMNANLGGRDHGAMYVEKQVIDWCRDLFDFPPGSSGLVVSGTSIATIIALKAARDRCFAFASRQKGLGGQQLVGYTSTQTHTCVSRAFDILGIGSDALRKIPVNSRFEMDIEALKKAIQADRSNGLRPFVVIGTAGSVNLGAIDDLMAISAIAKAENLWFHVDGAFGASGVLSKKLKPRLEGIHHADSLAFDFHKWMHVNYDAGFVLIRSEEDHRHAFSERPDYLKGAERGLAAGNPWPVEYGPELSRGFRALKIWAQLNEHGSEKFGLLVDQNCEQAAYLGELVTAHEQMEVLAPVTMNICCFRYVCPGLDAKALDALNDEIVIILQLEGIAAPSTTLINGINAIRVNITNHRTKFSDLELLVREVKRIGDQLYEQEKTERANR